MSAVERQITINAPPTEVFAYVSDFSRHPEWADVTVKMESTSDGPVGQGSTFKSVGHQLGRDFPAEITVTEFVPGEKLAFEAEGDAFHFRHHFLLRPEDGGTRLVKGVERVRIALPFSLLLPVLQLAGVITRGLDGDLRRIKATLEEGAPAPHPTAQQAPAEPEDSPPAAGEEAQE
jgi:uncharacterized protein YndB with AHSA1/START domain